MKKINTLKAAQPLGHYSQAVVHNEIIYIATQLGIDPKLGACIVGTIEEQASRALHNIKEILLEAGSDLNQILRVTVFVSDIAHWPKVNSVYSDFLGEHQPARGIIPCGKLHNGFEVAFDVTAAVKTN